ncbi:MAG: multiprotein bridging factor aMBF1 [Candidatus Bathyarchaeia archaeon]
MNCEVCGREIFGEPKRVVIDGVKMIVCFSCAPMGTSYWDPLSSARGEGKFKSGLGRPPKGFSKPRKPETKRRDWIESLEPVDEVHELVRKARIKQGLTQEDLAKMAKEKLSVIQKIESGKMKPTVPLCKTLEHILRVKLLREVEGEESTAGFKVEKTELTLGDIARFKEKDSSEIKKLK